MPNYDIYFQRWLSYYTFYKWQNALKLNRNFICGSFNKQQQQQHIS